MIKTNSEYQNYLALHNLPTNQYLIHLIRLFHHIEVSGRKISIKFYDLKKRYIIDK